MKKTMKTKTAALRRTAVVAAGALVAASSLLAPKLVMAENTGSQELLEQRLMIMEEQMKALQDELARVREEAEKPAEKVMELEEWVANVKTLEPRRKANMISFRGGFARNDHDRTGDILTDANTDGSGSTVLPAIPALNGANTADLTGNNPNGDKEGWYFGAAIEHSLSEDFFGLIDGVELMGEIMFEYKEFDQENLNRAPLSTAANDATNSASNAGGTTDALTGTGTAGNSDPVCASNALNPGGNSGLIANNGGPYGFCSNSVHVTQFTLSAAPKIKFNQGGKFRPWIIPAGFAFHVISPPSDGVTVNTVGFMAGLGAEYEIWNNIKVGIDGRYHLTDNALDGVNIDGLTAGGYLGFGF